MTLETEKCKRCNRNSKRCLAKIAGMAASRCYGVVGMTAPRKTVLRILLMGDSITKGVTISTENDRLTIDCILWWNMA